MNQYVFIIEECLVFFFQEEDGIRDSSVTGVQTCALPIFLRVVSADLVPPGLKGIIGRDEIGRDDAEDDGAQNQGKMLFGDRPGDRILIREHGAVFWVDPFRGQKTGFFLDQRENRFLIRRLSKGREVLNCFSYTGGFSINAALGGARRVISVDSDLDAMNLARENFAQNSLSIADHQFLSADVFKVLAGFKQQGASFDLIILDPPAFAKSQRAVEAAVAGYASLKPHARSLLRSGGLLATASCSGPVTPQASY